MKVTREDLDGSAIQQLLVTDPGDSDHVTGEAIAYFCPECLAVDETLRQLYHEDECSHAGEHGRRRYNKFDYVSRGSPTPEFAGDASFQMLKFDHTEGRGGLCEGEVLGFECECGMADEELFGIIHDESCPLAGVHDAPVDSRQFAE